MIKQIRFHFCEIVKLFHLSQEKRLPIRQIHHLILRQKGQGLDVINAYHQLLNQFMQSNQYDHSLQINQFIIDLKQAQSSCLPLDLAVDYIQQANLLLLNNKTKQILEAYHKAESLIRPLLNTQHEDQSITHDLNHRFADLLDRIAQQYRNNSQSLKAIQYQTEAINHTQQPLQLMLFKFKLANDYLTIDPHQTMQIIDQFKQSTNHQDNSQIHLQISFHLLEIKCQLHLQNDVQHLIHQFNHQYPTLNSHFLARLKQYEIQNYQAKQQHNQAFRVWIEYLELQQNNNNSQNIYEFICQAIKFPQHLDSYIQNKILNYIEQLQVLKDPVVVNYLQYAKAIIYQLEGNTQKSQQLLSEAIQECQKLKNHEDYIDQYYWVQAKNGDALKNVEQAIKYRDRGQLNDPVLENYKQMRNQLWAEAKIYLTQFLGDTAILKERLSKSYRHPDLDKRLTNERILSEVKIMAKARKQGVNVPYILNADLEKKTILMMYVEGKKLKDVINNNHQNLQMLLESVGRSVARLHNGGIIHGDLTTSNMMLSNEQALYLIDFGLSYVKQNVEDYAVDLYVLEKAFLSTHPTLEKEFAALLEGYKQQAKQGDQTLKHLDAVRMRGRKKLAFG